MDRTVMIVDDKFYIRKLLRAILELEGYTVVAEATDGDEAVRRYRQHRPAITIMDSVMPGKGGVEASREILALNGAAKLIMCSSLAEDELARDARAAGAHAVIRKPFRVEQVLEAVEGLSGEANGV